MLLGGGCLPRTAVGCVVAGFVIALVLGVGGALIGVWVAVSPLDNPFMERFFGGVFDDVDTKELPGEPRAFDPFLFYPEMQEYAGDGAQLVEIDVALVRRDGTLDLQADYSPKPEVTYEFVREVPRPDDAPPPGVSGSTGTTWFESVTIRAYEPGQQRQITRTEGNTRTTVRYRNEGMERTVGSTSNAAVENAPTPACGISEMWDVAIERGAPPDGVARIHYDASGYRFSVTGYPAATLEFDIACRLRA